MEKIDRELLIKEISTRLPYGVKAKVWGWDEEKGEVEVHLRIYSINTDGYVYFETNNYNVNYLNVDNCLLYLRPMLSMTEEERIEFSKLLVKRYCEEDWEGHVSTSYCIEIDNVYTDDENGIKYPSAFSMNAIDWLNAHHFDHRGLIDKGLALEAQEDMYK